MHVARRFELFLEAYRRPDGSRWTGQQLDAVGYGASGFDVGSGQSEPVYRDARYRATCGS